MKLSRSSYLISPTSYLSRGFTLIEMIVALGIFSIVSVVALGALAKIISANHKAQTLQSSITNLNFALDAMSREMRVGSAYHCDVNPTYGYSGTSLTTQLCGGVQGGDARSSVGSSVALAFISSKTVSDSNGSCNLAYVYRLEPTTPTATTWFLQKASQTTCDAGVGRNDFSDISNILDPSVTITGYYIKVTQAAGDVYPMATIRLSGFVGTNEKEKSTFDVQTTVSARVQ